MKRGKHIEQDVPNGSCFCGEKLICGVYHSAAGYYIGYWCNKCGPYSRETEYFSSMKSANDWFENYYSKYM